MNIYGCYVGNVFSFMDYDFQAIREEEKKGTSGYKEECLQKIFE